ncbi:hypothetical protein CEXT_152551 [Caerostris extrusa]|uniref:Uncharacterized protein n=1 Tax=Caerostris extrusa TaxID=172846 RepID=A0AAV4SH30_CAEEX|nr:hypothetical protein CEXT_152551 [Caerostris extrusa]
MRSPSLPLIVPHCQTETAMQKHIKNSLQIFRKRGSQKLTTSQGRIDISAQWTLINPPKHPHVDRMMTLPTPQQTKGESPPLQESEQ